MEQLKQRLNDALAESLGEAYDCIRVWSAWSYGTMGPDDFVLVAEDDDRMAEIIHAVCTVVEPELTALRAQVSALQTERDELKGRVNCGTCATGYERDAFEEAYVESERQVKHWRDQHANEVKRAKILKDTTDLPLERVRAYELMGELQGQIAKLKEQLESADAGWIAWQEKHGEELLKREAVDIERDQLRAEVEKVKESEIYFEKKYKGLLCDYVDSFTALEKGAESMRERAVKVLGTYTWDYIALHGRSALDALRDKVAALPLKENEG